MNLTDVSKRKLSGFFKSCFSFNYRNILYSKFPSTKHNNFWYSFLLGLFRPFSKSFDSILKNFGKKSRGSFQIQDVTVAETTPRAVKEVNPTLSQVKAEGPNPNGSCVKDHRRSKPCQIHLFILARLPYRRFAVACQNVLSSGTSKCPVEVALSRLTPWRLAKSPPCSYIKQTLLSLIPGSTRQSVLSKSPCRGWRRGD